LPKGPPQFTPPTFRKVALLLLFAGLSLVSALALGFGPLMLDPFSPSAPPM
jgi:hypothetical protein